MPIFAFLVALFDALSYSSSRPDPPGWAHHDTGTVTLMIMIYLTALASKLMGWATFVWLWNVFGHEGSASVPQYPAGQNNQSIAFEAIIIKENQIKIDMTHEQLC